jgi:hypothetical protein
MRHVQRLDRRLTMGEKTGVGSGFSDLSKRINNITHSSARLLGAAQVEDGAARSAQIPDINGGLRVLMLSRQGRD